MRESDFSGSTFNGAYLEKAVAYKANFTGKQFAGFLVLAAKNYCRCLFIFFSYFH